MNQGLGEDRDGKEIIQYKQKIKIGAFNVGICLKLPKVQKRTMKIKRSKYGFFCSFVNTGEAKKAFSTIL